MQEPAETPTTARRTESEQRWAGLAGRSHGDLGARGCPIVFLHGLTFDHNMWDPIIEALPSSHPTIAFDLPATEARRRYRDLVSLLSSTPSTPPCGRPSLTLR